MATSSLGLRGLIWDKTPESWQKVILEHRIKTDYVEAIYRAIPRCKRGNNWKIGKRWLSCHGILEYKYHLTFTVAPNSKRTVAFWKEIINEIEAYESNCK